LEDIAIDAIKKTKQMEKNLKINSSVYFSNEPWATLRDLPCIKLESLKERSRRTTIFEEIVAKTFPYLMKTISSYI
jgi:hypothetical protein